MNDEPIHFEAGQVALTLDTRVYRLAAIKKTAHRFADRCASLVGSPEGHTLRVTLAFKDGVQEGAAREVVRAFFIDLLDQELREEVAAETGPMRALILAHAFSKTDLLDRGE